VLWLLAEAPVSPDPTWLTSAGVAGVLATVVIGFWKGWIISAGVYKQALDDAARERQEHEQDSSRLRQERDRALEQVYKGNEIAQRALEALERKTGP
jgi:hypothetical protein